MRSTAVLLFLIASPTSAFALEQGAHETISIDACEAEGLPEDFCARVGTEAYNVDSYEWSIPAAHAQRGEFATVGSACAGANATLERVRSIGADIRASLIRLASTTSGDLATHIATQLGRTLHTIQDDCAHHGMSNPQHAWASRMDTCTGSQTSPDLAPDAASCARTETAAVMAAFVDEVYTAGVDFNRLDGINEGWSHWPKRGDLCKFLRDAETWDGRDTRWENAIVVPRLREQLTHAITVDDRSLGDPCAGGASIDTYSPASPVNVSTPPPWCFKLSAFCVGKDDAPDEQPPWVDEEPAPAPEPGGCTIAPDGAPSGGWLLIVTGVVAVTVRRRRRR